MATSPLHTVIRNFYSYNLSSLMMAFYSTNLSLRLNPFISKDENGRSKYDTKNGQTTTVNYEGAAALYIAANNIIDGKESANGMVLTIPCMGGASLTLERRPFSDNGQAEQMETFLVITKNNVTIPFKFATQQYQVKEDGQMVVKIMDSMLGAFAMTIKGYLTGIGADRHLNKLPEDFDELDSMIQHPSNATITPNYQISYGNY